MINIFVAVAIMGAIIGCYTDFKGRWVPDYVSYFMIFFGLIGHGIISITNQSIWPFAYSLAGTAIFFGVANLMYYSGAWGGGDAKMLIGFGALLAFYPTLIEWPFLLTLFLNILLVGAAYGIFYMISIAINHSKKFSKQANSLLKEYKIIGLIILGLIILPVIIYFVDMLWFYAVLASWGIAVFGFFLIVLGKGVEDCMWKIMPISKLEIGDHIADEIRIGKRLIYKPKLIGIEEDDLKRIKRTKLKRIKIKEGIPYTPALLFGVLVSVLIGDLLWIIIISII